MERFRNRRAAGRELATWLDRYANADAVVLALPRGGVPIGFEIATRLGLPLDVLVVRKLGVPGHEELAMGAVASGGVELVDRRIVAMAGVRRGQLDEVIAKERAELDRRELAFRRGAAPLDVSGKTAILVDDGLATGSTMIAAIEAVRARGPAETVVAVPVGARESCDAVGTRADDVICLRMPDPLYAIGLWYEDFSQTSDDEVRELLDEAARDLQSRAGATSHADAAPPP